MTIVTDHAPVVSGLPPVRLAYSPGPPSITIEMGFLISASLGDNFVLDDPVKGVLDNTDYTLAGVVFVDVSQWASGQIATTRGRSRETDQYQTGSLNFTLRNESRLFDPSNTASPYYPGIQPRVLVNAYIAGVQIFGGYVDDYNVQYQQPDICIVTVSCLDSFAIPANTYLENYTPLEMLPGARITDVLDNDLVGFPATRNIATGHTLLASGTFNDVFALDHLQMAARSENGYLFVDRTGVLTFFDRYQLLRETSQLTFTDIGEGIGYQGITQKSQSLLLYNLVIGTRDGGVQQQAADIASQEQFLIRSLMLGELGQADDADVLSLCQSLVGKYSQPDVRFDAIVIELQSVDESVLAQLLALDLVQLVTVMRTPPGEGMPTTITKLSSIEGVSFALDVSASTYRMTINLGSVDNSNYFVLDDPVFGVLDTSKLNY